ncbi:hypothetical protein KKF84_03170, partial [Myxococcota bacterium]|nr:hypothetical protein [Myxococcota bacterium]MBU1534291.1 hypothetical protein [Myxococcota bacterium]
MYRLKSRCLIVLFALATLGCAKPQPMKITKTLDLPESDKAPVISTILDYGNYELPTDGSLEQITGDGKFVPGELLIIRGKNFGRLPTVTIAEKATPILARLGDGAIVTRMPHGIEAGTQNVAVSTEKGLHQKPVKVVRYALAQAPGSKDVVLFDAWNFTKIKSYSVGNVLGIAFSESSSYAYLVTGEKSGFVLLTMDLTAAPAPRFVDKKPFKGSTLLGFGYSASRKVFVAATNLGIKGFSVDSPGSPIPSPVQAWSKDIAAKDIIEAALSPDGKNVAIILTTDNTLALFDIQVLHNIKKGPRLKLMPDAKVPLLKSLKFHNEKVGSSLYVLTGDTPASLKVGYHDNKVIVLEVISARDRTLDAKVKIEETRPMMFQKVTPSALTFASRGVSKMEDTAITKWTRYFYFSTFHAELLTLAKLP